MIIAVFPKNLFGLGTASFKFIPEKGSNLDLLEKQRETKFLYVRIIPVKYYLNKIN